MGWLSDMAVGFLLLRETVVGGEKYADIRNDAIRSKANCRRRHVVSDGSSVCAVFACLVDGAGKHNHTTNQIEESVKISITTALNLCAGVA